jgi:hypothetical protein
MGYFDEPFNESRWIALAKTPILRSEAEGVVAVCDSKPTTLGQI